MKDTDRGFYDVRGSKSIIVVNWHDNKFVAMATNFSGVEQMQKVKRWSREKKASVEVQQPAMI
jgi:hypothetical protein